MAVNNPDAEKRLKEWNDFIANLSGADLDKIRAVNDFFVRQIHYCDDPTLWGQADYWAIPDECIALGAGDCEDIAISKYFTLSKTGVSIDKLRIMYVKELFQNQNHVVLAYYEMENSDPLILDSLTDGIFPLSARKDLQFVFEFNEKFVWVSGNQYCGSASRITPWNKLVRKIELAKNTAEEENKG